MTLTSPPTAVAPFEKGRLAAGISASATTITVSPIYKTVNGVRTKQGFDSTSGIALITQGDFTERISFEGASVNATTKVTTLTTCVRGLSVTSATASFSGGTGRPWPKGAKITLIADASYFQSGVFKNVANSFTAKQTFAAGADFTSVTRPPKLPELTQAEENALTPEEGMMWKNTDTGTLRQYSGGAISSVGTDATANGSTTVAGKYEEATVAEQGSATATGATGARLVPAVANLVKTSSGAGDENKLVVLDSGGQIALGFMASGTPTGTKFIRDDRTLQSVIPEDKYGDESDGVLNVTSGTTTIDLLGANIVTKQYTSINVSNGATLAFSNPAADGTIIVFRCAGNVTFAGTVDLRNLGATGNSSPGNVSGSQKANGGAGTNAYNAFGQTRNGGGGSSDNVGSDCAASGGGGGASMTTSTTAASTATTGGSSATGGTAGTGITAGIAAAAAGGILIAPGAGGGSGGAACATIAGTTAAATGGVGGRGAGSMIVFCKGNYSDASGTINAAGTAAGAASKTNGSTQFSTAAGGGGGGGGGTYAAFVKGTINSSGTRTVTGGAGTDGTNDSAGGETSASSAGTAGGDGVAVVLPILS